MLPILALFSALAAETVLVETVQGPIEIRPVVTGARDSGIVIDALTPHLRTIGACFPTSLLGFERVDVAFTVDAAGKAAPGPASPNAGAPHIEACVRDIVAGATYAPADGPSDVKLGLDRAWDASAGIGGLIGRKGTQLGGGLSAQDPDPYAGTPGMRDADGTLPGNPGGLGGVATPPPASHAPGTPHVGLGGEPIILGALDRSLVERVLGYNMSQIRYCYTRELKKSPSTEGKLVVKFVVDASGQVTSSTIKSTTANAPELETCVSGVFAKLRFPEPKGGGIVIVSYPLMFTPG